MPDHEAVEIASLIRPGFEVRIEWGQSPLGLDLGAIPIGGFWVDVSRSFSAFAHFRFIVSTDAIHSSASPFIGLTRSDKDFYALSGYSPVGGGDAADFSTINLIRFFWGLVPEQGTGDLLNIDSIVASQVHEPEAWSAMAALGLL